jgi:hypothetical protein
MFLRKILFNYFSDVERSAKLGNNMGEYIAKEEVKQGSYSAIIVISKVYSIIKKL